MRRYGNVWNFPFLIPVSGCRYMVYKYLEVGCLNMLFVFSLEIAGQCVPFHLTQIFIVQVGCVKATWTTRVKLLVKYLSFTQAEMESLICLAS